MLFLYICLTAAARLQTETGFQFEQDFRKRLNELGLIKLVGEFETRLGIDRALQIMQEEVNRSYPRQSFDQKSLNFKLCSESRDGNWEGFQAVVALQPDFENATSSFPDDPGDNAMFWACSSSKRHKFEKMDVLLNHGVNINKRDRQGRTPLLYMLMYGLGAPGKVFNSVQYLIRKKADVNVVDYEGNSPLSACLKQHIFYHKSAMVLLEKGAEFRYLLPTIRSERRAVFMWLKDRSKRFHALKCTNKITYRQIAQHFKGSFWVPDYSDDLIRFIFHVHVIELLDDENIADMLKGGDDDAFLSKILKKEYENCKAEVILAKKSLNHNHMVRRTGLWNWLQNRFFRTQQTPVEDDSPLPCLCPLTCKEEALEISIRVSHPQYFPRRPSQTEHRNLEV